jgi:hypothetical protein
VIVLPSSNARTPVPATSFAPQVPVAAHLDMTKQVFQMWTQPLARRPLRNRRLSALVATMGEHMIYRTHMLSQVVHVASVSLSLKSMPDLH